MTLQPLAKTTLALVLFIWQLAHCASVLAQAPTSSSGQASAKPDQITPQAVEAHELHNVWRLSERVISGSEPEDDAAFAELVGMGVKTIISVDGIAPRVDLAQKHGLRYVHIPIGYDGISADAARALTRVARDITGNVYVHCHHGKHRGPAAAAVLCRADDGRSPTAAQMILEKAGTGHEYPGLWQSVAEFRSPPPDAKLPELTERAPVESLASSMAKVDRLFDRIKASLSDAEPARDAAPEPSPWNDSVQLTELFVESARSATDAELRQKLEAAGKLAKELSSELAAGAADADAATSRQRAGMLIERLSQSCTACHRQHRN